MKRNVQYIMDEIRNNINYEIIQNDFLTGSKKWHQLCSCMDIIEDTQEALNHYKKSSFPKKCGGKYIYIYGALQALYLQQDAIKNLSKLLDFDLNFKKDYQNIFRIRELRNDLEHPTDRNKETSFHFISRITMSKNDFSVRDAQMDGINKYKEVHLVDEINLQNIDIQEILEKLLQKIKFKIDRYKKNAKIVGNRKKISETLSGYSAHSGHFYQTYSYNLVIICFRN